MNERRRKESAEYAVAVTFLNGGIQEDRSVEYWDAYTRAWYLAPVEDVERLGRMLDDQPNPELHHLTYVEWRCTTDHGSC